MLTKIRHGFLISLVVAVLMVFSFNTSRADTVNYVYDDLNRLWRVEYGTCLTIEYTYDRYGNRTQEVIEHTTPPETTPSPPGGFYNASQSVSLTCYDCIGCDKIYYTTDGTDPTTASPVYSSPISIPVTTTLKFFAKDLIGNSETVKSQTYTLDTTPPASTAVPAGGTYTSSQSVTLSCNDSGGSGCDKIYYTTNGTDPNTGSPVYSSPINISVTTTLKFFAKDLAGNSEGIKTENYAIPPVTTASPPGGLYNAAQNVTLTCNDGAGSGCSTTYYSIDGSPPSTIYTSPVNISALGATILKFFSINLAGSAEAVKTETYTIINGYIAINGDAPYTNSRDVTLNLFCSPSNGCSQMKFSNNNITYSTAEAFASTKAWTLTTGSGNKTVYVKYKDAVTGTWSSAYSDTIILDMTAPTGTITINSGAASTGSTGVTLTLSCSDTNGCSQMQFSNDNITYSTPETYATTKAWTMTSGDATKTVYVKFMDTVNNWSTVYNDTIILDTTVPATAASPAGGVYNTSQSVTLTCNDGSGSGCDKIYYTIDGTDPNTGSPVYSSPINISVTTTLKFFAKDLVGNTETPFKTEIYTFDTTPPTGTISINSGAPATNSRNVTLTLDCTDPSGCSQMRFSNNGSTYSTAEAYATTKDWTLSLYAGNKTVYVKFKDTPGNWSSAFSDTILYEVTDPTTTASPPGGTYSSPQSVTLTCNDGTGSGCDKIYYTTNGTDPTTSSPVYSSPINISVTTTLKFFATDLARNNESVKTQVYTISP